MRYVANEFNNLLPMFVEFSCGHKNVVNVKSITPVAEK